MFSINHSDAIELEHQVRRLFKCDRCGVSGLADADNFESNPLDAAIMVVSYIHAKGLQTSETQYDEFLCKYVNMKLFSNTQMKMMRQTKFKTTSMT